LPSISQVNGSGGLSLVPMGRETRLRLVLFVVGSSFSGAYLPIAAQRDGARLEATWQVSFYGRNFPQHGAASTRGPSGRKRFAAAAFGVELIEGVNAYRVIERAIKYGVLFLALVFTNFLPIRGASGLRLQCAQLPARRRGTMLILLGLLALSNSGRSAQLMARRRLRRSGWSAGTVRPFCAAVGERWA